MKNFWALSNFFLRLKIQLNIQYCENKYFLHKINALFFYLNEIFIRNDKQILLIILHNLSICAKIFFLTKTQINDDFIIKIYHFLYIYWSKKILTKMTSG